MKSGKALPTGWTLKKLEDLGVFLKGKGILKEELSATGLPCIRYGEIYTTHDFTIKRFQSFISRDVAMESERIYPNDILFAGSGETLEEIGKAVAYTGNEEAYAGGDVVILRIRKEAHAEYLSYALNTNIANRQKRRYGQGHSVVHIYGRDLAELRLPLPPAPEQRKIALILSTWDHAIEKTEQLISQKQQLKKGLMQQLMTGKVRFKEFVKSTKMRKTKWGMVPEDWEMTPLKDLLLEARLGGNYENSESNEGVPVIKMGNLARGSIRTEKLQCLPKFEHHEDVDVLREGDLLFNTRNTLDLVGKVAIWRNELPLAVYNSNLLRMKFQESRVDSTDFMNYVFNSNYGLMQLRGFATGTTSVAAIYDRDLKGFKVMLPSRREQSKICQLLRALEESICVLRGTLNQIKSQKIGLMQQLLTGKVRVKI
jgi:type I restriction enzyme S subunit